MVDGFVHQLQRERILQIDEQITKPEHVSGALTAQIGQTDAAVASLKTSLAALGSVPTPADGEQLSGDIVTTMSTSMAGLSAARLSDDQHSSPQAKLDSYWQLIMPVLGSARSLAYLDHAVARDTTALHWLSEATEIDALQSAHALVDQAAGTPTPGIDLPAVLSTKLDAFRGSATESTAKQVDAVMADPVFEATTVDAQTALDRTAALHGLAQQVVDAQQHAAERVVSRSNRAVLQILVIVGAALAVVVGLALAVAAGMNSALRSLSRSAQDITDTQLPAMVDSLKGAAAVAIEFPRIDTSRNDEFGKVAKALDGLGRMATVVTAQQSSAVRKGIGDIYVNLARRNQQLLDRQIEFIDRLESNEEDPDQLDKLFKLDHLATRMRRNAESLLVLAGAEAPRDRNRRVAVTDVMRVAIGEVEDFDRLVMSSIDEVSVHGAAAADLAHLLSELMENGTQFSAPDRSVEVSGAVIEGGRYRISVVDQGIGMSTMKAADANRLLAEAPVLGLSMSRSLGFVVASTLAARHDIEIVVSSAHRPGSGLVGTTVTVTLPAALVDAPASAIPSVRQGWTADGEYVSEIADVDGTTDDEIDVEATAEYRVVEGTEFVDDDSIDATWWFPAQDPSSTATSGEPKLDDALPAGEAFETGIYSLLDRTPPEGPDGLPQRRPGLALGPTASAASSVVVPARNPDQIRSVLSRYRGGLTRGRKRDEGEGSDSDEASNDE